MQAVRTGGPSAGEDRPCLGSRRPSRRVAALRAAVEESSWEVVGSRGTYVGGQVLQSSRYLILDTSHSDTSSSESRACTRPRHACVPSVRAACPAALSS